MKNPFLKKVLAASRLGRQGKLVEATLAIQRALSGSVQASVNSPIAWPVSGPVGVVKGPIVLDGLGRDPAPRRGGQESRTPAAEAPLSSPGRFIDSSFTGAAGTRAFKLFAPAGHAGEMLRLVVMLHGCTQDPDDFAAGTRMNALAQDDGFFVLYPAQAARSNAHKCWNWFSPTDQRRGAGEPALLAGMVRHVLQTYPVDPDRVYVAGLSAGGAMAAILASEYPDLFAAAGIHSGIAPGAARDAATAFSVMKSGPTAPTTAARSGSSAPVIVFHGDADPTVAAANGDAVIAAALRDKGQTVAETIAGPSEVGTRPVQRTVWRPADASAEAPSLAEHWVVQGAAHAWSGGAATGSYTDPQGPDASREMLRFFRAHPRRRT